MKIQGITQGKITGLTKHGGLFTLTLDRDGLWNAEITYFIDGEPRLYVYSSSELALIEQFIDGAELGYR